MSSFSDIGRNCSIGTETKDSFSGRQGSSTFTIENILGSVTRGESVIQAYTDISDDDLEVNEDDSDDESIAENDFSSKLRKLYF